MIVNANALHNPLTSGSVHCVVTSPPYWGLRDYGTARWIGGVDGCDHSPERKNGKVSSGLTGGQSGNNHEAEPYRDICGKCGAVRVDGQLGLERTPEEYVSNMVAVFREVWRVLRDDGVLWLNIGDSYVSSPAGNKIPSGFSQASKKRNGKLQEYNTQAKDFDTLKPKDLVGIPWRLAFALQAGGWYLRSDVIWSKPNPMPESVTDRPTKAHEYIFLLTKSARYFYDAEAVREDGAGRVDLGIMKFGGRINGDTGWNSDGGTKDNNGRNLRSVWTMATQSYSGAHYATFPEQLAERCIKAGTSERGVCPKCGKQWARVINHNGHKGNREPAHVPGKPDKLDSTGWIPTTEATNEWQPSCKCDAGDPIPALVFDPFVGSGTTVKVAYDLGRRGVGLDLSLSYLSEQARQRSHNGHVGRLI